MSKKATSVSVSVGPGFLGCLCLLFVGLKLSGEIDWSWLWVLSPIWLPFALPFILAGVVLLVGVMCA